MLYKIPVREKDVPLGQPLLWPVYGPDDRLLIRKGAVINDSESLIKILAHGAFRFTDQDPKQSLRPRIDPFTAIDDIAPRVNGILKWLYIPNFDGVLLPPKRGEESEQRKAVLGLVNDLQTLCENDGDAALGAIFLSRDFPYTVRHPIHVAILTELVGKEAGMDKGARQMAIAASLTCNVASLELQETLFRQSSPPTADQRVMIRRHPELSAKMLVVAGILDPLWITLVKQHHERLDGSGYPDGIEGEKVRHEAQLIAMSDIYCAMITPRAYREPILVRDALREVFMKRSSQLDADLTTLFINQVGIYPPGSAVKLGNGERAVVVRRQRDPRTPLVGSFEGARGNVYQKPLLRNTQMKEFSIQSAILVKQFPRVDFASLWNKGQGGRH